MCQVEIENDINIKQTQIINVDELKIENLQKLVAARKKAKCDWQTGAEIHSRAIN
jgi:hypothetical protein